MEDFFENELVKKFEKMIENNEEFYFDSEEMEEIIIYFLEIGDLSFAELAVNFAIKLHPQSQEIKTKKLEVLLELEDYPQSKNLIMELEASCNDSTDYLVCCAKYYSNLGNPYKAIEYCKKALLLEEEENFLHNFIGDELVNMGEPFQALEHYQSALFYDPFDDYALENCLHCYYDINKYDEALVFLNNYIDRYPYSETAWFELGQFFVNRKKYDEAIKAFDFLLAINNDAVGIYSNKAACYEYQKKWKKAIEVYEEALEYEFTKAYTFYRIGQCYRQLKQNIPALTAFQKAVSEDPQFYHAIMEQSHIYEDMGMQKEALYFAQEATMLNDSNLEFLKRLAYLFISNDRYEDSLSSLKKVVHQEPNRFYNWYAFTEVLILIGEYEEAITILHEALKRHNKAELHYQLSNCWYLLSNQIEAQKHLKTALELDATIADDMLQKYPAIQEEVKKVKSKKNN